MKIPIRFFLPLLVWLIITTVLMTLPGSAFPQENWFDKIWLDKWIHIGLFTVMSMLMCWALVKKPVAVNKYKQYFIIAGLVCLGYGIVMEFVQKYYIANRSFDLIDIVADGIGSTIGALCSLRLYKKNRPL